MSELRDRNRKRKRNASSRPAGIAAAFFTLAAVGLGSFLVGSWIHEGSRSAGNMSYVLSRKTGIPEQEGMQGMTAADLTLSTGENPDWQPGLIIKTADTQAPVPEAESVKPASGEAVSHAAVTEPGNTESAVRLTEEETGREAVSAAETVSEAESESAALEGDVSETEEESVVESVSEAESEIVASDGDMPEPGIETGVETVSEAEFETSVPDDNMPKAEKESAAETVSEAEFETSAADDDMPKAEKESVAESVSETESETSAPDDDMPEAEKESAAETVSEAESETAVPEDAASETDASLTEALTAENAGQEETAEESAADEGTAEEKTAPEEPGQSDAPEGSTKQETTLPESPSEPENTAKEPLTQEQETLSPEARADLELREQCLARYGNLGIVDGVNNYLNMRSGPSMENEICGVIFRGCAVDILDEEPGDWLKIRSGDAVGYVSKAYIASGERARELALSSCRYEAEVVTDTLDVYYAADPASGVITTARRGDRYVITGYQGNEWARIEAVQDLSGFVRTEGITAAYYLEEGIPFGFDPSVSQLRRNIINTAFQYLGGRYVWGGESLETGVDCSAYVLNIYNMNGVNIGARTSIEQATKGVPVSEADIRPGDLIFYVGRIQGQIGHVAIYIGNGKIIHAASESKGICVSSWKFVPIVSIRDVIMD